MRSHVERIIPFCGRGNPIRIIDNGNEFIENTNKGDKIIDRES